MIAAAATDWGITIIIAFMIGFGIWGAWTEYIWHRDQERKHTRQFHPTRTTWQNELNPLIGWHARIGNDPFDSMPAIPEHQPRRPGSTWTVGEHTIPPGLDMVPDEEADE